MEEPEKLGISGWGEVTVTTVNVGVILKEKSIGSSGVRALPLAAGINEGGHYFRYIFLFLFSWCYHQYSKPHKGLS